MIVAIIGSRKYADYQFMLDKVYEAIPIFKTIERPNLKIISGGAHGADTLGKLLAQRHDIEFEEYLPEFKKKGLPYRREYRVHYYNRDVEIAAACDVLLAFLVKIKGENKGSRLTILAALDRHKEVHVFYR
jgi:hypothetical protein